MQKTKKVIILDRVNSKFISQAIFILKDCPQDEFSALEEAERIVREYALFRNKKKGNKLLYFILGTGFFVVFAALYVAFL